MTKRALITGITGQDGSYLAELLLRKGYEVHGLIRRASTFNTTRIDHLYVGPARSGCSAVPSLRRSQRRGAPRHAAAARSARTRSTTLRLNRTSGCRSTSRSTQPTSPERAPCGCSRQSVSRASNVGSTRHRHRRCMAPPRRRRARRRRSTRVRPMARQALRYWITRNYREAYGMFAVNGILFNHESPRRGETFVTRKITRAVAAIKAGSRNELYMGNLDAVRDWGYAPEYVEGMWRMLQADEPDDYVLATGIGCTVRDFLRVAFEHAGLDWEQHVRFDERYLRPTEVDALIGDADEGTRAARVEGDGRRPIELARLMVDADIEALRTRGSPMDRQRDAWRAGRPCRQAGPVPIDKSARESVASGRRWTDCAPSTLPATRSRRVGDLARLSKRRLRERRRTYFGRIGSSKTRRSSHSSSKRAALRGSRGGQSRRNPGQQHASRRVSLRQSADPD